MAHVPRMTPVGYLVKRVTDPEPDATQVLRCEDCGALVDEYEGRQRHLAWHRSHDNSGPGDASAVPALAKRTGW